METTYSYKLDKRKGQNLQNQVTKLLFVKDKRCLYLTECMYVFVSLCIFIRVDLPQISWVCLISLANKRRCKVSVQFLAY